MENKKNTPMCIGVIIDGNRRWAKANNKTTKDGHRAGYENLKKFVKWARDADIKHGIAYSFSTENWNRDKNEVTHLMDLMRWVFKNEIEELKKEDIKIVIIGEKERFAEDIQKLMITIEQETRGGKFTLGLALSYGGRAEILNAVQKLIKNKTKDIDEKSFSNALWTKDIPDPDLIIRTGGEKRLSNFLPWQSVYSELFFTDTFWPDFSKEEFLKVLEEFSERDRRRGR